MEPDPGLGNGGLGRLAACYLDALTSNEYPSYRILNSLRIRDFQTSHHNGWQQEFPDQWLDLGNMA